MRVEQAIDRHVKIVAPRARCVCNHHGIGRIFDDLSDWPQFRKRVIYIDIESIVFDSSEII